MYLFIDFVIGILLMSISGGLMMTKTVSLFIQPAKGWIRYVLQYIIFGIAVLNKSWIGDENPLILFPFFIATFLLCYKGSWYSRLVTGMIFYSLLIPLFMMIDTATFTGHDNYYESIVRVLKLISLLVIWLCGRKIVPKNGVSSLSPKLWGLLGGLTLAPLFSTLSFTIWNAKNFDYIAYQHIVQRIAYTILPFTALSALTLLVAMAVLSRHEEMEERHKLAEMREAYYQSLRREHIGVRTLRHDMHNHIAAAQVLLKNGENEGAQQYLEELSCSPKLMGGKRYCQNDIANAVISSKVSLMEENEIQADIKVSLPDKLTLSDVELCALLGNALDNAIEAAKKAEKKCITLRARADKGLLMLRLENTLAQIPKHEDGNFITLKNDTVHHGYGFAGMQEIAQRHGGMCEAEYTQTDFCLIVSIPIK